MANLPESATFEAGIYQLEGTDAVEAGVGGNGIANLQPKQLANRTQWLKQEVDALNLLKGKGIAAFSTANSYAGGDQVINLGNIWKANTAITPGAWNQSQWTVQFPTQPQFANDTGVATTEFVQRALGNFKHARAANSNESLVAADAGCVFVCGAGSDVTLTLPDRTTLTMNGTAFHFQNTGLANLVVAAFGGDSIDVGATSTTSVSLPPGASLSVYRSQASTPWQVMGATGADGATQPQFANDRKLATTEFVQRALGNMAGNVSVSGPTGSLSAANAGKRHACLATTLNLPATSALPDGAVFHVSFSAAGGTTLVANGTDKIYIGDLLSDAASAAVSAGSFAAIVKVSAGVWVVMGTASLKYEGQFGASLAASGYHKLPSGLIIQWGVDAASSAGTTTITFPTAFPTACRAVTATNNSAAALFPTCSSITPTTFGLDLWISTTGVRSNSTGVRWIAIGY